MTVTTPAPTEPATDAKAGYCSRCRNEQHFMCASPPGRCACPVPDHPQRPKGSSSESPAAAPRVRSGPSPLAEVRSRARVSGDKAAAAAPPAPLVPKLREPVWELVRADPPAPPPKKPKKLTVVEHARPFVEQLMAENDRDWHRFALFPTSMGAAQTVGRLRKAYREMEFKAVRVVEVGQSAVYGRWTAKKSTGQL